MTFMHCKIKLIQKTPIKLFPFFIRFLFYVIANWWYMSPSRCWHWNNCNNSIVFLYNVPFCFAWRNMSSLSWLKKKKFVVRLNCFQYTTSNVKDAPWQFLAFYDILMTFLWVFHYFTFQVYVKKLDLEV